MFETLDRAHQALDAELEAAGDAVFLGEPVTTYDLLGERLHVERTPGAGALLPYSALMDHRGLADELAATHARLDGFAPDRSQFAPTVGATALLTSLAWWIASSGHARSVVYIPPVFHRLGTWLDRFGVHAEPLTPQHAWEHDFTLTLPDRRALLILTDPIWYAGRAVPARVIAALADWQQATDSLVVVDGTFQYLRWDGRAEHAAQLDPERTVRLLSPNKSLGINGLRFAYAIAPAEIAAALRGVVNDMHGPCSWYDVEAARRLTHALGDPTVRRGTAAVAQHRARQLRGHVDDWVEPEAGYFVFAKVSVPGAVGMGAELFQLAGHPGFTRLNLLNDRVFESVLNLDRSRTPPGQRAELRP